MNRLIVSLFTLLLAVAGSSTAFAQAPQPPEVAAKAYLLLDVGSDQVLSERQADVQADPAEMANLAANQRQQRELVLAMNEKLNRLIDAEVGEDRGQMLPGGIEAGWEVSAETMAP